MRRNHFKKQLLLGLHALVKHVIHLSHNMASALAGLLGQVRATRSGSESTSIPSSLALSSLPVLDDATHKPARYPGSLNHQQRTTAVARYRSMFDIEEAPSLPLPIQQDEPMENWVTEKLNQAARKHTTIASDWADILCFYTATNGVAPAAPTRAPAPVPNGKAVSPSQEVPQSVSSTDPKVAAQQASDMRNIVRRKLTGYVGFANLPNQWHRKSVRKGFNFNVMVVGNVTIHP